MVSIHSEYIDASNVAEKLKDLDGILVAPGFGERGIEGKIEAVRYARENNIPFFGICLGMQMAVIEYSRNVLGLKDANSTEMNDRTSTSSYQFDGRTKNNYRKRRNNASWCLEM